MQVIRELKSFGNVICLETEVVQQLVRQHVCTFLLLIITLRFTCGQKKIGKI